MALGALLRDSGYDEGGLRDGLGRGGSEPLAVLARLFVLGAAVGTAELARATEPLGLDSLVELGLVEIAGDRVRPLAQIDAFRDVLVAHDPQDGNATQADHVLGVGAGTSTLATLTVRRPVETALDLGTGSGAQALLAARHCERVVGIDVNPRALAYARLSAELSGIANLELRESSFFDALGDETFDLIVANPPFVVSPDSAFVYRDSGEPVDTVSRNVVAGAAACLRDGGYASVLCSWVHAPEQWEAPPREWVAGSGCDAWILYYGSDDPTVYAARWNETLRRHDVDEFASTVARWRDYYESAAIGAIAVGAVLLRKRRGRNWVRADEIGVAPRGDGGAQIERVFAVQEELEALDDTELLDERLALVEEHSLEQRLDYRDGVYTAEAARVTLHDTVGVPAPVALHAIHVLFGLDGTRTLRELADEVVATTGIDAGLIRRDTLATARRLVELGIAVRVGGSAP
jgi:hypothetical protein